MSHSQGDTPPRVFLLDPRALVETRRRLCLGEPDLLAADDRLLQDAGQILDVGPFSVVEKESLPPSGDKCDYMSLEPYWWPNEGSADGMTIDSKGNLWIAMAMGWKVVQYGPDGKLKRSIRLPARFVSSLTFGGKDLSQLFVTTGRLPEGEELGSAAGTLISLNPGPIGLPEFRSKIRI